jgi:hypothetical protein
MVDQMQGPFLFAGLFSLVPTGLLLGLLVVFALRTDADDAGGRASALYLSMAAFVALFTLLAAAFTLTTSVVDLVSGGDGGGDDSGFVSPFEPDDGFGFEESPSPGMSSGGQDADDRAISAAVASAIVAVVAAAILAFHPPAARPPRRRPPGGHRRLARRSFRLVTCLTAVLIVLVTASLSLYGVYSIAAPGVAGAGDRGDALEGLIPVLVLLGGAGVIFRLHWDDERPPPVTSAVAP